MPPYSKNNNCIDCGKPIDRRAIRCRVCECKSRTISAPERFFQKVDKNGHNGCWIWQANCIKTGFPYGLFMVSSGNFSLAHRYSWELHHKQSVPDGLDVLHKCDNPKCVNPDHLFIGTHADNMQDMANKGRTNPRSGEQNNMAKLTRKQVIQIRKRYATTNVSQPQLAQEYGVSQTAIWYIIHKRNWKHI